MRLSYITIFYVLVTAMALSQVEQDALPCWVVTSARLIDAQAPRFADYPAIMEPLSTTAKLDLKSNPLAKTYRTVLRKAMTEGPNYAGYYRVAIWGCGSSCATFAVINLKTGRVIAPPKGTATVGGDAIEADNFLPNTESEGEEDPRRSRDRKLAARRYDPL